MFVDIYRVLSHTRILLGDCVCVEALQFGCSRKYDVLKPKTKKTKQNKTKFIKFPRELGYQIDVLETEAFYCFYCSPLIFLLYFDKRC